MGAKIAVTGALVCALGVAYGCALGSRSSSDDVGSTEEDINGGQSVVSPGNPIAAQFPLSTVMLQTPAPDAGWTLCDGGKSFGPSTCTGVIVSRTQILTAAHCRPNAGTTVTLYGPGSDLPTSTKFPADPANPVSYPSGVFCDGEVDGGFPDTCFSDGGVYSDLAVVNINGFIFSPNKPITLPPPGGYRSTFNTQSAWDVGVGITGDGGVAVRNPSRAMNWVPTILTNTNDAGDDNGQIDTQQLYALPGDSGGPLYRLLNLIQDAGAGSLDLTVMGILSSGRGAFPSRCPSFPTPLKPGGTNTFTSLLQPFNNAWVWGQLDPLRGPEFRERDKILPWLSAGTDTPAPSHPSSEETGAASATGSR